MDCRSAHRYNPRPLQSIRGHVGAAQAPARRAAEPSSARRSGDGAHDDAQAGCYANPVIKSPSKSHAPVLGSPSLATAMADSRAQRRRRSETISAPNTAASHAPVSPPTRRVLGTAQDPESDMSLGAGTLKQAFLSVAHCVPVGHVVLSCEQVNAQ